MTHQVTVHETLCNLVVAGTFVDADGPVAWKLVTADDGSPYGRPNINVPGQKLEPGETIIKDYAEGAGMLAVLVDAGIVEDTGRTAGMGMPIVRILHDDLKGN